MRRAIAIGFLTVVCSGCGEIMPPVGPDTAVTRNGLVYFSVRTTGGDWDANGYDVLVNDTSVHHVGVNAGIDAVLPAASYRVELTDVAPNCSVGGTNPRDVKLSGNDTLRVPFAVQCRLVGIRIITNTTGVDVDPDGYIATVEGQVPAGMATNHSVAISRLSPGEHSVLLSGLAGNCAVDGDNPRIVTVPPLTLVDVTFLVRCTASTGTIEVSANSSGVDPDPDGYSVRLDNGPLVHLSPSGTVAINGVAAGSHLVSITDVRTNCVVAGANPRAVVVAVGGATRDTARTSFGVSCFATHGSIQFIVSTAGSDVFQRGYGIWVDGSIRLHPSLNETVVLNDVEPGDHEVRLEGIGANCTIADGNMRTLRVTAGTTTRDTVRTSWHVTCANGGDLIAFARGLDLVVAAPDGSVTATVIEGADPAWSPDGRRLAYRSYDCSYYYYCYTNGIAASNTDGTGVVQLSDGASDAHPSWHPNGTRIVFTRRENDRETLFVMNADGSAEAPLSNAPQFPPASQPAWSPDGTTIAFTCEFVSGNVDICLVNADGTGVVRLTTDPARDSRPAWRPDGSRIAFTTTRYGIQEVATMSAAGGAVTRVTTGSAAIQPSWSPDGNRIVFASFACDIYSGCGPQGLVIVNADGTGRIVMTTGADNAPAWRR